MKRSPDLSCYGIDYEDPPQSYPTVPPAITPGQRFAEVHPNGRCEVYDWCSEECACVYPAGELHAPAPDLKCGVCKGTGDAGPVPDLIASNLTEPDARLLVFGPAMLALVRRQLEAIKNTPMSDMNYAGIAWAEDARKLLEAHDAK